MRLLTGQREEEKNKGKNIPRKKSRTARSDLFQSRRAKFSAAGKKRGKLQRTRRTQVHEMFLAEVSRGVNVKKPESELHSGSEQQGEEPGCADQPPPAAVRVEMRPRADIVYV